MTGPLNPWPPKPRFRMLSRKRKSSRGSWPSCAAGGSEHTAGQARYPSDGRLTPGGLIKGATSKALDADELADEDPSDHFLPSSVTKFTLLYRKMPDLSSGLRARASRMEGWMSLTLGCWTHQNRETSVADLAGIGTNRHLAEMLPPRDASDSRSNTTAPPRQRYPINLLLHNAAKIPGNTRYGVYRTGSPTTLYWPATGLHHDLSSQSPDREYNALGSPVTAC